MVSLDRFMPGKKGDSKPSEPPESPRREPVKAEKAEETSQREGQYPEEEPYDEVEAEPEELGPEEYAEGPEQEEVVERTIFEAETPKNAGPLSLLSVTYSGSRAKALLKLYDLEKGKTVFWYDNTGHLPYCLTDTPLKEVLSDRQIASHPGFDRKSTVEVEKYDPLHDKRIGMTKVVARDPLSIGGRGRNIRDLLQNSWEDNIRYHDCYIYDRGLIPGYSYRIKDGNLVKEDPSVPLEPIRERFQRSPPELLSALTDWFPLFISPVPDYRRVAVDIEVATEALDRIPDPSVARNQVICASLAGSDGLRKVLLLKRMGVEEGIRPPELPEDVQLEYFEEELSLIKLLFKYFLDYPIVITFNGDNFDLHYLWRRAQVLGMKKEEVPIIMGREIALLPTGVHIDLYKFMHNHAIQIYAFGNSYREVALDAVASSLLNIKKIQIEKTVSELSYLDLASYCFRDSLIALRLTTENSNMVMNLITMIMRISRLSMEDVTRQGISRWIRGLFFFEHRARNCLIPRESDIEAMKGEASTTAVIKGKKYHGAIVIKPESNVYFDVVVLDFASLYPSIIAKWNLSYETVRCVHESCRTNVVPDTKHWVCTKRLGLMALIIGLLKDVRVKWFKAKSKDPALTQEERDWYKVVQQALKVFLNACFTGDTDILTTNGVKNVKDINIGDKVINVNPATLEPEVDEVVETQVFDYNGDLLHFKNGRSTDLIVTPEHRFIVADHKNGGVRFVTAEAIYNAIDFVVPKLKTSSASSSRRFYDEGAKLFRITWRNINQHTDHWKKTKMPYNGQVYCITTKKNHTVFAGRNGRLIPCGQSYGVFGAEIFPLYCLSMADSTTAIGRHIITETIKKATESGVKVIYADTDSLFLYQPTKEQIGALLSWAESSFGIDLEVDKRYTFVTFSGRKKNYLGVMDNGVVDIKGLMGKKRNTPVFIQSAFGEMTQVLKEVKTPQDFARAKARIKGIVQNCYTRLKNRRFSLDELTFKVMLSRPLTGYHKTTPQHVKAAKQLEDKGKEVKPGDIISFVKVQGGLGVKPVQLARIDEIDVDKYVGHIESTFGQVLEALGIEFDEIVGIKRLEFFSQ